MDVIFVKFYKQVTNLSGGRALLYAQYQGTYISRYGLFVFRRHTLHHVGTDSKPRTPSPCITQFPLMQLFANILIIEWILC